MPEPQRGTPVAVACFPNEVIAALGAWGQKPLNDVSDECPKAGDSGATTADTMAVGLCLVTAQERRWHVCPACSRSGDTPDAILAREIQSAQKQGAKELDDAELKQRYGFQLNVTP